MWDGQPIFLEAIEALLLGVVIFFAFRHSGLARGRLRWIETAANGLSRRTWLAMIAVGLLPIAIRTVMLPIAPVPVPTIHDEFSFLMQGETFASPRLANPAHPFWKSFETVYVLPRPTYSSQYPPAQGLVLAAAMKMTGQPWVGVLASMGILCALLFWMLRAWLPPRWALLGACIAVFQFGVFDYWVNSYWGGQVPAIGGTLVLGALPRLRRSSHSIGNALLIGLGLAILANSRPVEGFILGLVLGAVLLWWVFKARTIRFWTMVRTIIAPISLVLAVTIAGMGYYNYRVTGDAWKLPYVLHREMYGTPQSYYWQSPVPEPVFRHPEIRDDYLRQLGLWERRSSLTGLARSTAGKFRSFWMFYVGPSLTLLLLFLPWIWKSRGMGLAAVALIPLALDHLTFHAFYPHYAAPEAGLILLCLMQGWRQLRTWRYRGRPVGRFLAAAIPLLCVAGVAIPIAGRLLEPALPKSLSPVAQIWEGLYPRDSHRQRIREELHRLGGRHLVFVHYREPGHNPDDEWVYNHADIDRSTVIWAIDQGRSADLPLIRYYPDRRVWLLEADEKPPRLSPYPLGDSSSSVEAAALDPP